MDVIDVEPDVSPTTQGKDARTPGRPMTDDIAIVHDYLNQCGGAERVVLELANVWPRAAIYTSLYRATSTFPEFGKHKIHVSPLDRLPVDQGFRSLFPLYPLAFRSFGRLAESLVISSSSGWAHAVRTHPHAFHAVYCHTPARWLYGKEYFGNARRQSALRGMLAPLRIWDQRAAKRPNLYIANSESVRRRIGSTYGRDATVVYPPVDVDRFSPKPRGERLLVVSRLLPYKRVDIIVDAATKAKIGLDVVGVGPALEDLRRRSGPNVVFHGRLEDGAIVDLMETCNAFCLPGEEDFGITTVEAQAAGKPVIAFAGGGALETVEAGLSGAFFEHYDVRSVLEAVGQCDVLRTDHTVIAERAKRFSVESFRIRLRNAIDDAGFVATSG